MNRFLPKSNQLEMMQMTFRNLNLKPKYAVVWLNRVHKVFLKGLIGGLQGPTEYYRACRINFPGVYFMHVKNDEDNAESMEDLKERNVCGDGADGSHSENNSLPLAGGRLIISMA